MQEFDLFVIGAGSGGVRCARIAASYGARVGIVERRHWGGTCVNLGCVPKKLLTYAVEAGRNLADAPAYGWPVGPSSADGHYDGVHHWQDFMMRKDSEIVRLNGIYLSLLEKAGVSLFTGEARFLDAHTLEIGPSILAQKTETIRIRAKRIVIATGSTPSRLEIPGSDLALTSDDVFSLKARPERIAIIGGGYIGVEFAGIFAGLGSEVSMIYRQDKPLRGFDQELRERLGDSLPHYGITSYAKTVPEKVEKTGNSFSISLSCNGAYRPNLEVDAVLMATGRHPFLHPLALEKAGVAVEQGRIVVNRQFETSVPSIFAIGDVTNDYNLTPTAIAEGHLLAEQLFAPQGRRWSFETTPKAVFFSSPLASVGLTEEEASSRYENLAIYTTSFTPMKQILPQREGKVFMKLIVDEKSDEVVGVHIMGPDAPEIVQCLAIAVTARLGKKMFDHTIALHPTTAEEIVTLRTPTRYVRSGSVYSA